MSTTTVSCYCIEALETGAFCVEGLALPEVQSQAVPAFGRFGRTHEFLEMLAPYVILLLRFEHLCPCGQVSSRDTGLSRFVPSSSEVLINLVVVLHSYSFLVN